MIAESGTKQKSVILTLIFTHRCIYLAIHIRKHTFILYFPLQKKHPLSYTSLSLSDLQYPLSCKDCTSIAETAAHLFPRVATPTSTSTSSNTNTHIHHTKHSLISGFVSSIQPLFHPDTNPVMWKKHSRPTVLMRLTCSMCCRHA